MTKAPAAPVDKALLDRLGDRLVASGAVERADVERAAADLGPGRLGEALLAAGAVEEREIYRALAAQRGWRYAEAEEVFHILDPAVSRSVPRRFQETQHILPVARLAHGVILATCNPDTRVEEVAMAFDRAPVEIWLVTPTSYRRLRAALDLGQVAVTREESPSAAPRGKELLAADGTAGALDSELVALFDALLLDAIGERASDIHLERYGDRVRVRLRIDGDLHDLDRYQLTPEQHAGMVNVLKVNAHLDIAERRLPQGGRFSAHAGGHSFDLRVQTQPSLHGEHAVVRLLPQDTKALTIEDLGFPEALASRYRRLLASPAGMVLVVGPTGSGKSTTLYAGLQELAHDTTRKVISVEDPIEYAIDGVQQTQVHAEIGFSFAGAMRVFVRQDPDVILLGEIRDNETALEAIRASQTGHLVLSTLHCNDAVDAVQRLFDLGMHPNSVASELIAVFAQRLAKRLCPACREVVAPDVSLAAEVFPAGVPDGFRAFRGRGCERCNGLGTRGRIAVMEYLPATPSLRRGISRQLPLDEMRFIALSSGLEPMREQALQLVTEGVIPFENLLELLPPERLAPEAFAVAKAGADS